MRVEKIAVCFQETRPQFLVLTPVCFMVGTAVAYFKSGVINTGYMAVAFLGALAAHVAVNVLNDYIDYKSGLDLKTVRTPFSGGSGILPGKKMSPSAVLALGLAALAITVGVGVYFLNIYGWKLLLAGLPGLLLVGLYTQTITRYPLLCLLAPGLGFGPCMVLGTYYVLQGSYDLNAIAASLVPGFLVSNLLLLNQFPDVEADRDAKRRHLPILIGKTGSSRVYTVFSLSAYVWIIITVFTGLMPLPTLLALLSLPLALRTIRGVQKYADKSEQLIPYLGLNVVVTLVTPFLVSVGFLFARF